MRKFVAVGILLALAASAHAGVITTFVKVEGGLPGYTTWEIMSNATTDWTNSRILVQLTAGEMYQDAVGGDTEPNPVFFPVFPDLQWDTYLAVPAGHPKMASFAGEDVQVVAPQRLEVSWFDSAAGGEGLQKIGQITLSNDAQGEVSGKSYDVDTQGVGLPFGPLAIIDGQIIPEPATMGLLALGGLVALLRRRR